MQKKHFLFAILMLLLVSVEAQAGSTDVINNYVNTISGLIGGKITIITITIIMIFSGILSWKNASISPLGWGAAASVAVGGSGSIAESMKNIIL